MIGSLRVKLLVLCKTRPRCFILQEKNLLKRLEDDLNEYTLFIPSDTYARTVNVTVVSVNP